MPLVSFVATAIDLLAAGRSHRRGELTLCPGANVNAECQIPYFVPNTLIYIKM
jgi:hypothetical protein